MYWLKKVVPLSCFSLQPILNRRNFGSILFFFLPERFWTIFPGKIFNYHVTEFSYSWIKTISISPAGAIPLGLIRSNILRHSENDSVTWGLWYSCGKWGLRVQAFASINIWIFKKNAEFQQEKKKRNLNESVLHYNLQGIILNKERVWSPDLQQMKHKTKNGDSQILWN